MTLEGLRSSTRPLVFLDSTISKIILPLRNAVRNIEQAVELQDCPASLLVFYSTQTNNKTTTNMATQGYPLLCLENPLLGKNMQSPS